MSELLLKRWNNLLQLSAAGDRSMPKQVVEALHPTLSFKKTTFVRPTRTNYAEQDSDFNVSPVQITEISMYEMLGGALVTGVGLLTKLVTALQALGLTVRFVDLSPPRDRPDCYVPDWDSLFRNMPTLRPKQVEALQKVVAAERGVLTAATGFGKSFLVEGFCHLYPGAKIHYVVPQRDVAKKVYATLVSKFAGVGFYGAGNKLAGERITVFTAGSRHYTDGDADILLLDEVHEMMTDRVAKDLVSSWPSARIFGLTATPSSRSDGADAQLELFCGPEIFRLTYREAVELNLVVPIRVRWINVRITPDPVAACAPSAKMRHGVWRNNARNAIIAADVRANYPEPSTQILVLCATVDHAIHLWQHLREFSLCFSNVEKLSTLWYIERKLLPHGFETVTPAVREAMRQRFAAGTLKRVIATDVWMTGVDFTPLQVLYRVDARASAIKDAQGPGRVSRLHDGKLYGEVVDCYDSFNPGFRRRSDTRRRNYASFGWTQTFEW